MHVIRIAVLGEVRLNREGLAVLLQQDRRLRVAGSSSSADGLSDRGRSADVLVVDTAQHDGATSIERIIGSAETPVVVLGTPEHERDVVALAELGVMGFVERDASLEELIATIIRVATGEASLPPRIATMLLRRVSSPAPPRSIRGFSSLTGRERQIVQLIAEGLSNKEIATKLYIEVATVKNHVHNILEKLQVSKRSDAVERLRLIEGGASQPAAAGASIPRTTTRSTTG